MQFARDALAFRLLDLQYAFQQKPAQLLLLLRRPQFDLESHIADDGQTGLASIQFEGSNNHLDLNQFAATSPVFPDAGGCAWKSVLRKHVQDRRQFFRSRDVAQGEVHELLARMAVLLNRSGIDGEDAQIGSIEYPASQGIRLKEQTVLLFRLPQLLFRSANA